MREVKAMWVNLRSKSNVGQLGVKLRFEVLGTWVCATCRLYRARWRLVTGFVWHLDCFGFEKGSKLVTGNKDSGTHFFVLVQDLSFNFGL